MRVPSTLDRRSVKVRLTERGRQLVAQVTRSFEADVSELLQHVPAAERKALTRLVSRLLVAHACGHGVDLFATVDAGPGD